MAQHRQLQCLTCFRANIWWFVRKADLWQSYGSSVPDKSQTKLKGHLLYFNDSLFALKSFFVILKVLNSLCLKLDSKQGIITSWQSWGAPINLAYFSTVGQISTVPNLNTCLTTMASIKSGLITTSDREWSFQVHKWF